MRALILLAAAALPLGSATAPAEPDEARVVRPKALGPPKADCPDVYTYQTARPEMHRGPQQLTDLPDANAYAAVYREVDGCEVPVVVSFGIGR